MAMQDTTLAQDLGVRSVNDRLIAVNYRPSGFDYMRIALSCAVLLWHSYCVSYPVAITTELWLSPVGYLLAPILPAFFALSGFLVFGSLERNNDIKTFLTLRAIRIYPALIVEVLLSAFILGPIVTTLPLKEYFTGWFFYTYLLNVFGWVHYVLPGVFEDHPMVRTVNVSMWTVPYELECYILLAAASLVGYLRWKLVSVIVFVAATVAVAASLTYANIDPTPPGRVNGRVLVLCFLAGTLIYRFRERLRYSLPLALVCGLFAIVAIRDPQLIYLAPLPAAYAVAYIGLLNPRRNIVVNSGDYSYGVYLYGAPIQQSVVWAFGPLNSWALNVAVALPIVVGFALFSWHFVEKPFMQVKKHLLRTRNAKSVPLGRDQKPAVEQRPTGFLPQRHAQTTRNAGLTGIIAQRWRWNGRGRG